MLTQTRVTIYINDAEVEADATFDCTYDPPDRSVGWSGGWEVELYDLRLGGLKLTRTQAGEMLGKQGLEALEDQGAEAAMREAA